MECLFDEDEPCFATWLWIYDNKNHRRVFTIPNFKGSPLTPGPVTQAFVTGLAVGGKGFWARMLKYITGTCFQVSKPRCQIEDRRTRCSRAIPAVEHWQGNRR
jgi:hypothetical protein